MPKLKINDISMYYEVHGKGDPIVFIAGFSVDHLNWEPIIDKFKNDYQVIVFDNRGAGQTDVPLGPYSIEIMAADVVDLCSVLKIKRAHFVANSMGGFILQTLAYRNPDLIRSAVISNSTFYKQSSFHFYLAAQLELLKAKAPLAALIKASSSWVFSYRFLSQPGVLDALVAFGLNNPYPFTVAGYEGQFAALEEFNSSEWLSEIHVPMLVMSGDQDIIFNAHSVKLLAEKIAKAEYYCFKDCGHLPQIEYPDLFSQIVKNFIAKK